MLVDALLARLFSAQPKYKVEGYLREIREKNKLTSRQLRATGTVDDLKAALREALNASHVTVKDLARYVDDVEENGNQHIFIFDLTDSGVEQLTRERAQKHKIANSAVTEQAYAPMPEDRLTARVDRYGRLMVKQVYTAAFWRTNESESEYTVEREIIVRDRVQQRALNLLVVDIGNKRAEIRIARVEGPHDSDQKAIDRLSAFLNRLTPFFDREDHVTPTPIWNAFHAIATNRDEVRMRWDRGAEATATQTFSSRLLRGAGDIRDHPDYHLDDPKWARRQVRVEWKRGSGDDVEWIFTRLAEVQFEDVSVGKIEVHETLDPEALNYVIGRIREHTAQASGGS